MKNEDDTKYSLPRSLHNRLASIGSYVRSIVNEEEEGVSKRERLSRDEVETITHVVFACLLAQFFRAGSQAARSAVDEFARHGVSEFAIGSTVFSGRNENVLRGDTLADDLLRSLSNLPIQDLLQDTGSPREMVLNLMKKVKNGRSMDRPEAAQD
jgi:hypothetical protein